MDKNNLEIFENHFQNEMRNWFSEDNILNESCLYSLNAGGKRIRPLLTVAIAKALGGNLKVAFQCGSAIEMIHTYSLIHDDLPAMDNDDLRRGKPTNHKVFGEAMAILAGDALLNEAPLFLKSKLNKEGLNAERINNIIFELLEASGARGMILGQVLDISSEKEDNSSFSKEELLKKVEQIHYYKTGRLLALATKLGALSVENLANEDFQKVSKIGDNIGLAFQVMDDILDITASTEELGKTAGKDLEQNKLTYPSILGLAQSRSFGLNLLNSAEEMINNVSTKDCKDIIDVINFLRSKIEA